MRLIYAGLLLCLSGTQLVACGEEPVARAKVAAAGDSDRLSVDDAVSAISAAVCDRAITVCKSPDYVSHDDCMNQQKASWGSKWNTSDCTDAGHGPVKESFERCKQRAEGVECGGNIFDTLSKWDECLAVNVCE